MSGWVSLGRPSPSTPAPAPRHIPASGSGIVGVPSLLPLPEADFKEGRNRTHQNHYLRTFRGFTSFNEQVRGFVHHSHSQHLGTLPCGTWRGWKQGIQHPDTNSASTFPAPSLYQGKVEVKAAPRYLGYKLSAGEGHGFPGRNAVQPATSSQSDSWSTWHCPEAHAMLLRELEM